jgi:HNH endonuclease
MLIQISLAIAGDQYEASPVVSLYRRKRALLPSLISKTLKWRSACLKSEKRSIEFRRVKSAINATVIFIIDRMCKLLYKFKHQCSNIDWAFLSLTKGSLFATKNPKWTRGYLSSGGTLSGTSLLASACPFEFSRTAMREKGNHESLTSSVRKSNGQCSVRNGPLGLARRKSSARPETRTHRFRSAVRPPQAHLVSSCRDRGTQAQGCDHSFIPQQQLGALIMKQIPLTKGLFALVDDEDFPLLNRWKWRASKRLNSKTYSALTTMTTWNREGKKIQKTLEMGRMVIGSSPRGNLPWQVDHRDRNPLNNQKHNLRWATRSQNQINRILISQNKFGRGVVKRTYKKGFQARIGVNGKYVQLGSFKTASEAREAYDKKAVELFGQFAVLNKDNYKGKD